MRLATIAKSQLMVPKQHFYNFAYSCEIFYISEKSDGYHFLEKMSSDSILLIFTMGQFWPQKFWIFEIRLGLIGKQRWK